MPMISTYNKSLSLGDLIKKIRKKANLTQTEFAKKVDISQMYISLIERPLETLSASKKIPSEKLLRKIAEMFSETEEERKELEVTLLAERAKLIEPKEVTDLIERGLLFKKEMPAPFIKRLSSDVRGKKQALAKLKHISPNEVQMVVERQLVISKEAVIELAIQLKQDILEYLKLADYLPVEFENIAGNIMFSTSGKLTSGNLSEAIDVIAKVLRQYYKRKHPRK